MIELSPFLPPPPDHAQVISCYLLLLSYLQETAASSVIFVVVVVSLVFTIRLCSGFFWLLECTEQGTFLGAGPRLHPVSSVSGKTGILSPTVSLFQERKLIHNDGLYWAF